MKIITDAFLALYLCAILAGVPAVCYGEPVLYGRAFYQSPVSATPGRPLMLPGAGLSSDDTVVYQLISDTSKRLLPPAVMPVTSEASFGAAPIISGAGAPDSLTVMWPRHADTDAPYVIWVRSKEGEWSNGIRVNDARPLWMSPAFAYTTANIGALPRYLKVIGRNVKPARGATTRVKLVRAGMLADEIVLTAESDNNPATTLEQYVAKVMLPPALKQGSYKVSVSRDGKSWVPVQEQMLIVNEDPALQVELEVESFGCRPDDGLDDSVCIRQSIESAGRLKEGGATVRFGKGVWNLGQTSGRRIIVPHGVSLRGDGAQRTVLVSDANSRVQHAPSLDSWLILLGSNTVSGFTFKDATDYRSSGKQGGAVLQLGNRPHRRGEAITDKVSNVIIEGNVFDKPYRAIVDSGLPIERLFITRNEFGAYENAIFLDGASVDSGIHFRVDDSVIVENMFKPSSYMDIPSRRGVIATQIGASRRLDFSDNVADGQSTDYLYDSDKDPRGWRAAFFWHLRNNQEMLLVSRNKATCTGDKTGDGEFLAFDNNHNSFGFAKAQTVSSATSNTVSVPGPMQIEHEGRKLPYGFFREHWVQVADGPGVGQVRRIVEYKEGNDGVLFKVDPPWDVVPTKDSRILAGLEFWQLLVLDNEVDHRSPPCLKSNRRKSASVQYGAAVIGLWAQAADSVIAGNTQRDTNGIALHPFYSATGPECKECAVSTMLQYFVDVHGNRVEGEYDWGSDCSWSGITVNFGASPTESAPPPAIAYGLVIAGNYVSQADGMSGGGISIVPSWWDGPKAFRASLIRNTVIAGNAIEEIAGRIKDTRCNRNLVSRQAIVLASPTTRNTLLASNICKNVGLKPVKDKGSGTVSVKDPSVSQQCEYYSR